MEKQRNFEKYWEKEYLKWFRAFLSLHKHYGYNPMFLRIDSEGAKREYKFLHTFETFPRRFRKRFFKWYFSKYGRDGIYDNIY